MWQFVKIFASPNVHQEICQFWNMIRPPKRHFNPRNNNKKNNNQHSYNRDLPDYVSSAPKSLKNPVLMLSLGSLSWDVNKGYVNFKG